MQTVEEEHQIPQQISSYQFRLIGDMTIKQFMQVAAGALTALIIYSTGFPGYVKWPLIVISFLAGIAFAFLPLQDRPLSKWVYLFLKSIYSPTVFVWKKTLTEPQFFQPEPSQPTAGGALPQTTPSLPTTPLEPDIQQEKDIKPVSDEAVNLEKGEQEFLSKVSQHFEATPTVITVTPQVKKQPPSTPSQKPADQKGVGVEIPKAGKVDVQPTTDHKPKRDYLRDAFLPTTSTGAQLKPLSGQKTLSSQKAHFSLEAAPPIPPTTENITVGQVMGSDGKIVESAILEIKDNYGRSVRALKTNKLGHFIIVTPLVDGMYEISTEKEGYTFEPISFEAKGEIIPPIAIWAKKQVKSKDDSLAQ